MSSGNPGQLSPEEVADSFLADDADEAGAAEAGASETAEVEAAEADAGAVEKRSGVDASRLEAHRLRIDVEESSGIDEVAPAEAGTQAEGETATAVEAAAVGAVVGAAAEAEEAAEVAVEGEEQGEEWEVEEIVRERRRSGATEFLVHWAAGDKTWEPLEHVEGLEAFDAYRAVRDGCNMRGRKQASPQRGAADGAAADGAAADGAAAAAVEAVAAAAGSESTPSDANSSEEVERGGAQSPLRASNGATAAPDSGARQARKRAAPCEPTPALPPPRVARVGADGAATATPPKRARPSRLMSAVRDNEPARLAQLLERERAAGVSWPARLLHAAVGQPASLTLLLGSGAAAELPAQLEACDPAGHTPLSLACAMQPCNPEVAEALLRAGADAAHPVRAGASTALYEACIWPPRYAPPPNPTPTPCHAPAVQHAPPSCPAFPHDGSVRWARAAGHSWCRCCCGTATPIAAPSREAGRR